MPTAHKTQDTRPKTVKVLQPTSNETVNLALDTIKLNKQALVFVNTKSSAEKSAEEIAEKMAQWKPGIPLERVVDPVAALQNLMKDMSDEQKNALIEKLMAS